MDAIRYMGRRMTTTRDVIPSDTQTSMRRDLGLMQLTLLGIGSTIGAGIYVIIGVTTRDIAGPAIVVSFVIAGIATFMTSMCFAQYALRISRGSLYMYVVCTFGELIAFVVTWESMTGAGLMASVTAQGFSSYLNTFLDNRLDNFTRNYIGQIPVDFGGILLELPDVTAGFTALMCTLLISCVAVTYFASITSILAVLNSVVLVVFVAIGLQNADFSNWTNANNGGFAPFGFRGVLKGSAVCISAYAGFKCICMAAEETTNPNKTVPRSLTISAVITSAVYTLVSAAFTLLVPFSLAGVKSPLVDALNFVESAPRIVSIIIRIGPIFGMLCAMTLAIYGVSRLLFSMSDNGLLWSKFAIVSENRRIPVISSITVGLFVAFVAVFFELNQLVRSIALGALMTMVILSFGTILLIYQREKTHYDELNHVIDRLIAEDAYVGVDSHLKSHTNRIRRKMTSVSVYIYVIIALLLSIAASCLITFAFDEIVALNSLLVASLGFVSVSLVFVCYVIACFPLKQYPETTVKPLTGGPVLPIISGFINTLFFVGGCDVTTFVIFVVLNISGILVYVITCIVDYMRGSPKSLHYFYTRLSVEEQSPRLLEKTQQQNIEIVDGTRNDTRELLTLDSYDNIELYSY